MIATSNTFLKVHCSHWSALMRYLIAILLPPLAVLLRGKPIQAMLNVFLTMLFWIPGRIHALFVVNSHLADKCAEKIEKAIRETGNVAR